MKTPWSVVSLNDSLHNQMDESSARAEGIRRNKMTTKFV